MELMHIPESIEIQLGELFDELYCSIETEFEAKPNLTEIPHKSYDGFIPFTNGGVHLLASIGLDYLVGSGKGFVNKKVTDEIDKTVEYCYNGALEQFIAENRKALEDINFFTKEQLDSNSEDINYHTLYSLHNGKLAEVLSEIETGWLESTLFIEHRAQFYAADNHRNETGHDEICFMSGVNLDYEYGRDKGLEVTFELTVPVRDLSISMFETILKSMRDAI